MGELKCHIVRDLLPLYQDGLLSEESRLDIEEHLKECADCRELYEKIHSDLAEETENTAVQDIDYLKKVKRKNHQKTRAKPRKI